MLLVLVTGTPFLILTKFSEGNISFFITLFNNKHCIGQFIDRKFHCSRMTSVPAFDEITGESCGMKQLRIYQWL